MRKFSFLLLLLWVFISNPTHAQNNPVRLFGQTARPQEQPGYGSIYSINPDGSDFQTHKTFAPNPDGSRPQGRILKLTDGSLMGMTSEGGVNDLGVIYKMSADGTGYTKVMDLTFETGTGPTGKLIQATDGKVYGAIQSNSNGGPGYGTIFSIHADGTNFTKLFDFEPPLGVFPWGGLVQASDGRLYGTTVYSGESHNYGTVYGINTDGTGYEQLYLFDGPGAFPRGDLIEGADGFLYGMADGVTSSAVIFKVAKNGTGFEYIHHFGDNGDARQQGALLQLQDNTIIGLGTHGNSHGGVMFKIQPDGSDYTILHQFASELWPSSIGLTSTGRLYSVDVNSIFTINTDGTDLELISMGEFELHGYYCDVLETSPGTFIGVAREGGHSKNGGIFKVTGGTTTILKEFPQEGADPEYEMLLASNGSLYGKTTVGGDHGNGTLFKIEKDGTGFAHIYQFEHPTTYPLTGDSPAGLVESDGFLYGITGSGLYKVELTGDNFSYLVSSLGPYDRPTGDVCMGPDGFLYFITSFYNDWGKGHLYKVRPDGTDLTTVVDFAATASQTGTHPSGFRIAEGNIYLVTAKGGSGFQGILSKISLDGSTINKVVDLPYEYSAAFTRSVPLLASDGKLYVRGQGNNSYFSVEQDGSGVTTYPFYIAGGGFGSTIEPIPGKLFGTSRHQNIYWLDIEASSMHIIYQKQNDFTATNFTPSSGLLAVEKQAQTVTLENIPDKNLGDAPFEISATSSLALPITFTSSNTAVITVSGNTLTVVGQGTTIITARNPGSLTISDASDQQSVTVFGESQSIDFSVLPAKLVTDDDFTLSATATSGLTVTFSSSDPQVATITGSSVHIVGGGEVIITASQAGNATFSPAEDVEQTLVVNRIEQEISFGELSVKSVHDDDFDLEATASSELAVSYESSNLEVATISGSTVSIVGGGTTTITAIQHGNSIFNAASSVDQTLVVEKDDQVITFAELSAKTMADESFTLSATSDSGLPVSFLSSNHEVATVSENIVTIVGVGSTDISAVQLGNTMYNAAMPVAQPLNVTKASQEITFLALEEKTFGADAFDLTATSSSLLPVMFISSEPAVATINGATVTITGAGTTSITASQPGDDIYDAAVSVTHTLEVEKAEQVLTFGIVADKGNGDAPFIIVATSTSDLPIVFSSASDKITINGNIVTIVKAGRATILASQEGDDNYLPADPLQQSFCINPIKPEITVGAGDNPILTSSNDTGNIWRKGGAPIAEATGQSYTAAETGIYTVRTTIDDCSSEISEPVNIIVTGLEDEISTRMNVYPNPVVNDLFVELPSAGHEDVVFEIYDALGSRINRTEGSTNTLTRISMQDSGPGIYFLKASSEKSVYTNRVVKK